VREVCREKSSADFSFLYNQALADYIYYYNYESIHIKLNRKSTVEYRKAS